MYRKKKTREVKDKNLKSRKYDAEEFKKAKDIAEIINQDDENNPATETGKSLFVLFRACIKQVLFNTVFAKYF